MFYEDEYGDTFIDEADEPRIRPKTRTGAIED
jgi:hypothetical protein